jgi:putative ATP-dependent endonuclease of OLD family
MKIGKLVLENVTSYESRTTFEFDNNLNIFIGPNGGGKSNLQRIIAIVLTHYFIYQWQVRQAEEKSSLERMQPYRKLQLTSLLGTYGNNRARQLIEIELIPESRDIENITAIGNNLDKINRSLTSFEMPYQSYEPLELLEKIQSARSFTYQIVDRDLIPPLPGSGAYAFLRYLNEFFIFMRVTSDIPELVLSAPVFFFASDRALTKGFEIQAGNLTQDTYLSGFQNAFNAATGQTNLLEWGAQHFVRLYRRALAKAGKERGAHFQDFLRTEPDVLLLDRYLKKLGYGWDIEHDSDQTRFRLGLTRAGIMFFADIFSSGEREIVHFLLAMFALNVQDGLILVDEPELHLHPRWQRMFLSLFRELSPERNNQFLIATHSPVFVSPDTIHNIVRLYRPDGKGSHKVSLKDVDDLPASKQLVRMINSQNNERMFFADKVVLVEGASDRLVFGSLIERATELFKDNRAVEVIEVGGKNNFEGYQKLLDALKTPWTVVADRDYLEQVGSEAARNCFEVDTSSQAEALLDDKKSIDRKSLVSAIRKYLDDDKKDQLRELLQYIDDRHRRLRTNLSEQQYDELRREYGELADQGIELLTHGNGEIEDYMPERPTDLGAIVQLVSDSNWIVKIHDADRRLHLGEILCRILRPPDEPRQSFLFDLQSGKEVFSKVEAIVPELPWTAGA